MDILTETEIKEAWPNVRFDISEGPDDVVQFGRTIVDLVLTKLRSAEPVAEVRTVHYGAGSPAAATVVLLHDADNYWDLRVREGMKLYSAPAVTKADPKCASCGGSGAAYGFADADCECVTTHPAPSEGDRRDAEPVPLTDERIDHIADLVAKGMPEGIRGFCISWGYRQFARALLEDCAGHYRAAMSKEQDAARTPSEKGGR